MTVILNSHLILNDLGKSLMSFPVGHLLIRFVKQEDLSTMNAITSDGILCCIKRRKRVKHEDPSLFLSS